MLIVVAIIAILVAVSIPLVNGSLERARYATDAANERAAKAELLLDYVMNVKVEKTAGGSADYVKNDGSTEYYYSVKKGEIKSDSTGEEYGKCTEHRDGEIKLTLDEHETVSITWVNGNVTKGTPHGYEATKVS